MADDRQASKYQKKGPDGKVLPDEGFEKRGRLGECCLKLESDPAQEDKRREQSRQVEVKERFALKWRDLVLDVEHSVDEPVVDRGPAIFPEGLPRIGSEAWQRNQGLCPIVDLPPTCPFP